MDRRKLKRLFVGELTLRGLLRSILRTVGLVYLGTLLFAYLYGEKLLFQPQPSSYRDTERILKLRTGDGGQISAIYLGNPLARCTILFSHGNAEDLGQIRPLLEEIKEAGFSVLAYDYRGYGTSAGRPSEQNAYRDVDAAYDYLVSKRGVPPGRIIALGRSLGGALAVDLASRRPLGGLVMESSFVSAYRVLTVLPIFPWDKFRSIEKIKAVRCPVLVMHGKRDEVVPFWHGTAIFHVAHKPKLSFWVEGAGHNNLSEVAGNRYEHALRQLVALIDRSDVHSQNW